MTVEKYLEGIESIYIEQPQYKLGHDGSDGYCDCIGMCKGAIRRGGGKPDGLSGTNWAARYTIKNLAPIPSASSLRLGDVVLKASLPSAKAYALPAKYREGGSNYTGDLHDYYHIGTVTQVNPLVITHMTSPKPKKDTKLGAWEYYGQLPHVDGVSPAPSDQKPVLRKGDRGSWVTLAQTKLFQMGYDLGTAGVDGIFGKATEAAVKELQYAAGLTPDGIIGKDTWNALDGAEPAIKKYTVTIHGLTASQADALIGEYPGSTKTEERG